MTQNIPLAVGLVIIGSFCFALSAHFQHNAVDTHLSGNATKQRMRFAALLETIRQPRWMLGLGLLAASFLLQCTALLLAPVSVVQPVGLLAFPWSILLAARAAHSGVPKRVQAAVALTVASTLAFTIITGTNATETSELVLRRVIWGALVVYAIAILFGLLGTKGPRGWRSLFWSSGGALFYGLEAALVKSLIEYVRSHQWPYSPAIIGIIVALVLGAVAAGWMIQQGYATGPAEVVVGSMTVTSPVVAVVYGFVVLGEGARITVGPALLMVALGAAAIAGVVSLTRFHPTYNAAAASETESIS
ncbi:EamA/RhaT family transporter [Propioniciclava coleopterorum]|uniref:EamA/RhaT family transporter n=1 Tax=Propioniciclava coleopterorum TaxID=2714937 RepID=A0A6G7Y3R7_9ACTN|nr:EamA/RhaT family transporter [Propioniciclava coleopterorum]QIK71349.1 EamA/RhaT family transporter [Propioniciclava coleopterorum]